MEPKYFFITGFNDDTCKTVSDLLRHKLAEVTEEQGQYDFYPIGDMASLDYFKKRECKGFSTSLKEKYGYRLQHFYVYYIPFVELPSFKTRIQMVDATMLFCFDFNYIQEGYCPSAYINEPEVESLKFNLNHFMLDMKKAKHRNVIFLEDQNVHPLALELLQHPNAGRPIDGVYLARLLNSVQKVGLYRHFLQLPTTLLSQQYFNLNLITC